MILRWTSGRPTPGFGEAPTEKGRGQAGSVQSISPKADKMWLRERPNPRGTPSKPRRSILILSILLIICVGATAAPQREIPSNDEPLSIQHGFYPYSAGKSAVSKEDSRKVFYQLQPAGKMNSEPVGPPIVLKEKQRKKHRKPGRRKQILNGRRKVLAKLAHNDMPYTPTCMGTRFKQRVRSPGCLTKTITNRFCHGVCQSYFFPRMSSKKLKAVFKSCAACGPKEYDSFEVTLDCPGQDPPTVTKTVIKVKKCACINVDVHS